ncbi:MAG: hypothetical protein ACTSUE_09715 [Promethearchaeota archaeon]
MEDGGKRWKPGLNSRCPASRAPRPRLVAKVIKQDSHGSSIHQLNTKRKLKSTLPGHLHLAHPEQATHDRSSQALTLHLRKATRKPRALPR